MQNKKPIIKPYNKKELVTLLGVSLFVLNKWLQPLKEEIGEVKGTYYNANQVEIIFKKLGFPKEFESETSF